MKVYPIQRDPRRFSDRYHKTCIKAFADSGGNDYSAERTRRIRDAFIPGMYTHIRLKLLMQPETTTVKAKNE